MERRKAPWSLRILCAPPSKSWMNEYKGTREMESGCTEAESGVLPIKMTAYGSNGSIVKYLKRKGLRRFGSNMAMQTSLHMRKLIKAKEMMAVGWIKI